MLPLKLQVIQTLLCLVNDLKGARPLVYTAQTLL